MKRILINATHNEEVRVAICKDNHLYDFDLENRTREQKKANIYKGRITRVEQSLEAVFVDYGAERQGFLPLREIASEYLAGNPREIGLKHLIKEGDEVIVQVEKEERGNKGAALSTYISLAGRYLVLMPNNAKGGGISRQISGKVREELRQVTAEMTTPKGMSFIVRTAGIGKGFEELQNDLNHLLDTWQTIQNISNSTPAPCLLHQEASVVTRAMRDYLKDDIGEIWIDSEYAYNEAASFISQSMPTQMDKLRKYVDYEPLFVRFGIEKQIETAYQREVRLPSGGSIVIDQTEAMVAIDINSAKSTRGSDVAETAYHTNLEAADEIARQLRLRDMGGLIVIDFIDMANPLHQKDVEKRLQEATRYDRARIQFAEISKFGLLEMSRQRLRPSLDEATGHICPRCHGNGMIRDVRSLALSIVRQIEQLALKYRGGEVLADVPTEIAAFLLNEKRETLVYLEQESGTRITVLPHAHLESPNFELHYNADGLAPASYDRILDTEEQLNFDRGYDVNWQTPTPTQAFDKAQANHWQQTPTPQKTNQHSSQKTVKPEPVQKAEPKAVKTPEPSAVAWLSNLFAPKPQANLAHSFNNQDAASAIEAIINTGANSLGAFGQLTLPTAEAPKVVAELAQPTQKPNTQTQNKDKKPYSNTQNRPKPIQKPLDKVAEKPIEKEKEKEKVDKKPQAPKREPNSVRESRGEIVREPTLTKDKADKTIGKQEKLPEKVAQKTIDKAEKSEKVIEKTEKMVEKTEKSAKPTSITTTKADKTEQKPTVQKIQKSDSEFALHVLPVIGQTVTKLVHLPLDSQVSTNQLDQSNNHDLSKNTPTNKIHEADNIKIGDLHNMVTDTIQVIDGILATLNQPTQISTPIPTPELVAALEETANIDNINTQTPNESAIIKQTPTNHCITVNHHAFELPINVDEQLTKQLAYERQLVSNDPRIVLMAMLENTKPKSIVGTVGQFIRQTLPNADDCIKQFGIVNCFIQAVDLVKSSNINHASFANYGYSALPSEHWAMFLNKILATDNFGIMAGKTTATPPASARAKNDPRGEQISPITPVQATKPAVTIPKKEEAIDELVHKLTDELVNHSSQNATNKTPIDIIAKVANADNPTAFIQAVLGDDAPTSSDKTIDEQLLEAMHAFGECLDKLDVNGLFDDQNGQTNHAKTDNHEEAQIKQKSKKDSKNYKNMIEGIAEQLLPQTGILNLSKPTPVKIKIKKPKNESNKPKVEIVKRKIINESVDDNQN